MFAMTAMAPQFAVYHEQLYSNVPRIHNILHVVLLFRVFQYPVCKVVARGGQYQAEAIRYDTEY